MLQVNPSGPGDAGHSIDLITDEPVLEMQHSIPVSVFWMVLCLCMFLSYAIHISSLDFGVERLLKHVLIQQHVS